MRVFFIVLGALTIMLPGRADAQPCDPPQVLIVLDKSSSMVNSAQPGQPSKWDVAVDAIFQVVSQYDQSIDFGLMTFPSPNQCAPGSVEVPVGPGAGADILNGLGSAPPSGGNYTPMAQSLAVAGSYPPLLDMTRLSYVLLITDGWQWCDPYDPATRFLPVQEVTNMWFNFIDTFVVGFGEGVDALTLNRCAVEGGTAFPGCDETSSDPSDPNNCYFYADDVISLTAALDQIALTLTQELCDGVDNDCNGIIDDGLVQSCQSACGGGFETCSNGSWTGCNAPIPSVEICDGVNDEDCDGVIDEGCGCVAGQTRPCGIDEGACQPGQQECQNGQWTECLNAVSPEAESCDGIDNDCNGLVDDGLRRDCQTLCGWGEELCVAGVWEGCTSPLPTGEICDAIDNDCDGVIDDGSGLCGVGNECQNGACVPSSGGGDGGVGDGGNGNDNNNANVPDPKCGCTNAQAAEQLPLVLLLMLGLFWVRRRFRD